MIICKECNSLHFSNGHVVTSNVDHNYIVGLNDKYKELPLADIMTVDRILKELPKINMFTSCGV